MTQKNGPLLMRGPHFMVLVSSVILNECHNEPHTFKGASVVYGTGGGDIYAASDGTGILTIAQNLPNDLILFVAHERKRSETAVDACVR